MRNASASPNNSQDFRAISANEIEDHNSAIISHQSSVISHQSSVISHQSSVISHQSSAISHQPSAINPNSPKRIWIINPFDQLPNESDVPRRYWPIARILAEQGHDVIWWSSDFSHLKKAKRAPCPDTDGFSVRLIETPPYTKNISFARLKNHRAFADGFYRDAMAGLKNGELKAPDRIVVSLPPLGVAESAFRIRDFVRQLVPRNTATTRPDTQWTGPSEKVGKYEGQYKGRSRVALAPDSNEEKDTAKRSLKRRATPDQSSVISHRVEDAISHSSTTSPCEVVLDIKDAWPETFYQALPKPLRKILGPILLAPMHRSAKRAYLGADKISAVGQSYLDLAEKYLGSAGASRTAPTHAHQPSLPKADQSSAIKHQLSTATRFHLCYHGTDLSRFQRSRSGKVNQLPSSSQSSVIINPSSLPLSPQSSVINHQPTPLRAVYLGAMGSGYDLQTIIDVAARWQAEGEFPFQIHFAGDGSQLEKLKAKCEALGLLTWKRHSSGLSAAEDCRLPENEQSDKSATSTTDLSTASTARVVFHGYLSKIDVEELLLTSDLALVPNKPDSLVACPAKICELAAARLPMLSCLQGELGELLNHWNAGSGYDEGDAASLHAAFGKYSNDLHLLHRQGLNALKMAEALFDREVSYADLAAFILSE